MGGRKKKGKTSSTPPGGGGGVIHEGKNLPRKGKKTGFGGSEITFTVQKKRLLTLQGSWEFGVPGGHTAKHQVGC